MKKENTFVVLFFSMFSLLFPCFDERVISSGLTKEFSFGFGDETD